MINSNYFPFVCFLPRTSMDLFPSIKCLLVKFCIGLSYFSLNQYNNINHKICLIIKYLNMLSFFKRDLYYGMERVNNFPQMNIIPIRGSVHLVPLILWSLMSCSAQGVPHSYNLFIYIMVQSCYFLIDSAPGKHPHT